MSAAENVTSEALTAVQATELGDLEQIIAKGLAGFIEVGKALEWIRDRKLYRETHETFEDYLQERWKVSRSYAYRQIEAAQVAEVVSPIGDTPAPATESVVRELAPLKAEPEQARQAWQETVREHGPKPTAKQVRNIVDRRRPVAPTAPTTQPGSELPVTWTRVDRRHRNVQQGASPMQNSAGEIVERLRRWEEDGFVTRWPEPTQASIRSYDQLVAHYGAEEVACWLAQYDADHKALAAIRGSLRAALDRSDCDVPGAAPAADASAGATVPSAYDTTNEFA